MGIHHAEVIGSLLRPGFLPEAKAALAAGQSAPVVALASTIASEKVASCYSQESDPDTAFDSRSVYKGRHRA
jgi:hypothetical protein